jgi:hypothetical protein
LIQILSNIEIEAREVSLKAHPRDERSWVAAEFQLLQLSLYKDPSEWRNLSTCDFFIKLWDASGSKILAGHEDWTLGEPNKLLLMSYVARIYEILVLEQLADEIRARGCKEANPKRLKLFQRLVESKSVHQSVASSLCPSANIRLQQQRQILSNLLNSLGENPGSSVYKLDLLVEFCKEFRTQNFSPLAGVLNVDTNSIYSVQSKVSSSRSALDRLRQWPRSILSSASSRWRTIETGDGTNASSNTTNAAFDGDGRSIVATSF